MTRRYELRDPIHGFIEIDDWEREIINQPAFQRLRRIKQLAWTDMVYPGATHTRFEHSLGVMHTATRLFDAICARSGDTLESVLHYRGDGLGRLRRLIRLAALLHDIGHAPFSHAGEDILPARTEKGKRWVHEEYSAAIVEHALADVIENHPINQRNYGLKVSDIRGFFLETPSSASLLWRDLVSSQMDADRMDYMLRDSYHAGVAYGRYDLDRVVATIALVERPDGEGFAIGVDEDGIHAVEGLILARYMLFTQVYFHKTRVIYDYHLVEALKTVLAEHGGSLPAPDSRDNVFEYLAWDDWRVLGALAEGKGGEHGLRLRDRDHYRKVYETVEVPTPTQLKELGQIETRLTGNGIETVRRNAEKSWYKFEKPSDEIWVQRSSGAGRNKVDNLSSLRTVVAKLEPVRQARLYVRQDQRDAAQECIGQFEAMGG